MTSNIQLRSIQQVQLTNIYEVFRKITNRDIGKKINNI